MILAIRIYGHDEHRLKVTDDQEAPALKETGGKLHRPAWQVETVLGWLSEA